MLPSASITERSLELGPGDTVTTMSGEEGKVVYTVRLTAFVAFSTAGIERLEAHLLSQLTKVVAGNEVCATQ